MIEPIIHGICPTCYLVVTSDQLKMLEYGAEGQVAYHKDCYPSRLEFMKKRRPVWESEGAEMRELREENGCTLGELADYLNVSETKLRKFEKGMPVTHARLLTTSYHMFFELFGIKSALEKQKPSS